ncbi:protein-arginine deiminase family protein [Pseudobacteriovorax antillogorgiicola]|uniref:Protein-arginine deiminase (PAD) n=1 Tax=Pseudobacteriovorax antillogorgiicola TaxID=1513793 RepID=A0A1Y6C798_9BACT|nr:protein-arginine deiminase family protein [Pseudobacteriovorax antillogorgiicola]TCS51657.1 protein-arginine deiminase (PAD) [Pseudobacteriovorax antillogorgiicola]SMF48875.1 Protein-arginine deiminase (PAD) [Pseudobacteriovorax antillogorgiicola]
MKAMRAALDVLVLIPLLLSCDNTFVDNRGKQEQSQAPLLPKGIEFSVELIGLANLDNDSGGGIDFENPITEAEDELVRWELTPDQLSLIETDHLLELKLESTDPSIRVWKNGTLILGKGSKPSHSIKYDEIGGIDVEFGEFNTKEVISISHLNANGESIGKGSLTLRSAPLILNHHLQPSEHVYALETEGNEALIEAYKSVLKTKFTPLSGTRYQDDVWVQDEIEFATSIDPSGKRQDIIVDSIRDRGLAPLAKDISTKQTVVRTWGLPSTATTFDSFGNLEASPPVTVDGVNYPFGRIYYGANDNPSESLSELLAEALSAQVVQKPFAIDTSWLCVGHVDEFSTFVPDTNSPKGFKLLISDINEAYKLLEAMSADTMLPQYARDFGYENVEAILDDQALRTLNENLQENILDQIVGTFKKELGLDDTDIIKVPSLFEDELCGDGAHGALIPGMVNLVVADDEEGATNLFIPDPFIRAELTDQASDPFIKDLTEKLPSDLDLHFVDDWTVYHMGMGEIHCGTNVKRTPMQNSGVPRT